MARKLTLSNLSRRERQIMDAVYQSGEATAAEVMARIPSPPGYAAVRKLMRILEDKGYLKHRRRGNKFIYTPTIPTDKARENALRHMLDTFFKGSAAHAVIALLDAADAELSEEEKNTISDLIEKSKKEGR